MSTAPEDDTPLQVKIARAAYKLSVSTSTIRRLLDSGELRGTGRGQLRRIEWTSILEYIARQSNSTDGGRDNVR